ncbi:hypothetical protein N0V82_003290 [Gnomoniopsis sp. IMI 355080]|nr:hypothetical protein N0V82_003290 [Gnomoniopsis sp. IMI 355080]
MNSGNILLFARFNLNRQGENTKQDKVFNPPQQRRPTAVEAGLYQHRKKFVRVKGYQIFGISSDHIVFSDGLM